MIERFFDIQKNLVESVSLDFQRYLVKEIDLNERLVGIVGARGTGFEYEIVAVREIFFVNQVKHKNVIFGSTRADFTVNEKYIFEVGGKSKKAKQVDLSKEEFLVKDGIEIGSRHVLPGIFSFFFASSFLRWVVLVQNRMALNWFSIGTGFSLTIQENKINNIKKITKNLL